MLVWIIHYHSLIIQYMNEVQLLQNPTLTYGACVYVSVGKFTQVCSVYCTLVGAHCLSSTFTEHRAPLFQIVHFHQRDPDPDRDVAGCHQ